MEYCYLLAALAYHSSREIHDIFIAHFSIQSLTESIKQTSKYKVSAGFMRLLNAIHIDSPYHHEYTAHRIFRFDDPKSNFPPLQTTQLKIEELESMWNMIQDLLKELTPMKENEEALVEILNLAHNFLKFGLFWKLNQKDFKEKLIKYTESIFLIIHRVALSWQAKNPTSFKYNFILMIPFFIAGYRLDSYNECGKEGISNSGVEMRSSNNYK